jgi:hypothetical protein
VRELVLALLAKLVFHFYFLYIYKKKKILHRLGKHIQRLGPAEAEASLRGEGGLHKLGAKLRARSKNWSFFDECQLLISTASFAREARASFF